MRQSSSFCASRKDYMRRSILDTELTTFRTPNLLVVTSHPLESSHLCQLEQAGYKEARLLVFVLKQTASKSMIAPGFLLAIPLSRIDVCSLLFDHFACPLKPGVRGKDPWGVVPLCTSLVAKRSRRPRLVPRLVPPHPAAWDAKDMANSSSASGHSI